MNLATLRKISVGYLAIPNLLFAFGWYRVELAIPVIAIIAALFWLEIKKPSSGWAGIDLKDIVFVAIITLIWTFLSGSGGYSFQVVDYWGHNAKFYDLYAQKWPYYFADNERLVRYYFGYYLMPAFVFKIIGGVSPFIIFIWTWLGFFLALSWVYVLILKDKVLTALFLFIGGGGSFIASRIPFLDATGLAKLGFNINISSLYDQSRWVPNQLITSMIVIAIIMYDSMIAKKVEESFFPIALSLVWAVFPFVALCMIYLFHFLFFGQWKNIFSIRSVAYFLLPSLLATPVLLYLSAGESVPVSGFLWEFASDGPVLLGYVSGVLFEITIFYLLAVKFYKPANFCPKNLLSALFVTFLLLALFRVGVWNDWLTRMNIPFITIFLIIIFRSLHGWWENKEKRHMKWPLAACISLYIIATMLHQFSMIAKPLRRNVLISFILDEEFTGLPYNQYEGLYPTLVNVFSKQEADQYMAGKNSFFELNLAKARSGSKEH
jgi:hypothetical protein